MKAIRYFFSAILTIVLLLSSCTDTNDGAYVAPISISEKIQGSWAAISVKQIDEIDREIQQSIDNDETLSNQHKLLLSVDGVGERVAVKMIVETNGFKDFTDPRKFCCHAGVAPFKFTSGSSIRSRNKVSNRADKSIKALLHMAALVVTTTKKDGELREYYLKKVAEGKSKMSVLNAVRAKLVYRMFAVIRDNKFYEKNYLHQLA